MFSYRHAFHAGNHADVLKHSVLLHILNHLNKKDKAYTVLDTHAGAGVYDLSSDWSQKNSEHDFGFSALQAQSDLPPLLADYVQEIASLNTQDEGVRIYPGSPWICLNHLRPQDRLHLFELHPSEFDVLKSHIGSQAASIKRQVKLYELNGFGACKQILPPPSRRGLILIDPSYEDKRDYLKTVKAVSDGLARFHTGTYMVWYPLAQRPELPEMLQALETLCSAKQDWLDVRLKVKAAPASGLGLTGSGLFIINPPYTLAEALENCRKSLVQCLAQDHTAEFLLKNN